MALCSNSNRNHKSSHKLNKFEWLKPHSNIFKSKSGDQSKFVSHLIVLNAFFNSRRPLYINRDDRHRFISHNYQHHPKMALTVLWSIACVCAFFCYCSCFCFCFVSFSLYECVPYIRILDCQLFFLFFLRGFLFMKLRVMIAPMSSLPIIQPASQLASQHQTNRGHRLWRWVVNWI